MNKTCQNCKKEFLIDADDKAFYERMQVPEPTFCPACRFMRRAAYRNEQKLFRVKDAFTGADIFSLYPPESGRRVVTQEEWFSDSWDPKSYAREIDWSRPFIEQVIELEKDVPIYNLNVQMMVNSPYSGNATALKNCYLCFNMNGAEDCLYANAVNYSKDCVDNSHLTQCERCYEGFWLTNCYQCYYSIMLTDCRNMWMSRDCVGCNDCFGCTNLRKASYCIFNEQYSKEAYAAEIEKMRLDTASGVKATKEKARAFWATQPTRYNQGIKNVNSSGSYVTNCKNVNDSYLVRESENIRYCQYLLVPGNKECYDVTVWGEHTELCYETSVSGENSYNLKFCFDCWPSCRDSEYCMSLFSSADCFGSVGLKNAQYCILNKQYTKEEYEELVPKIKEHMKTMPYQGKDGCTYAYGEFFPAELSAVGYNNSLAMQYFPMTEDEAREKGYTWFAVERGIYAPTKQANELPDSIADAASNIPQEIISCEHCSKSYKIQPDEFTFLQKENLPLPRRCVECRFDLRISDRLKTNLHERTCMCDKAGHQHEGKCTESFKTGYAPESETIVYCEKCYQSEFS